MPKSMLRPNIKTLVASAAYTTTTTTAVFDIGIADSYHILINHTAVTGTSPTADIQLKTSIDGGTTYIGLPIRSTQVTAAGQTHFVFKLGLGESDAALESPSAATGGTLAKNCIFDPRYMKLTFTIGGTNPSVTSVVYGLSLPAGGDR